MTLAFFQPFLRSALQASGLAFSPASSAPAPPVRRAESARSAKWRLLTARELAQPGFMRLKAVRVQGQVVDFVWDSVNAAAARWLGHKATELCGQRMSQVLADHPSLLALFARYRCVVQTGAGAALKYIQPYCGNDEVIRHGAVRLGDCVAVTVTNLSALKRVKALSTEITPRREMQMAGAGWAV